MKVHSWDDSFKKEHYGNVVLDSYFRGDYIIARATEDHQRKQKIDRFFIHRKDGLLIYRVDYKNDWKAAETGNLALEDTSVYKNGKECARGWVHTTKSDLIIQYSPPIDKGFVMEITVLRERWREIGIFPRRPTYTGLNSGGCKAEYSTWNYCVPINWLRENKFFKDEFQVKQLQFGFF